MTVQDCSNILLKEKTKKELLENQLTKDKARIANLKQTLLSIEEAQVIFQQAAKDAQEQIRFHLEDIVNLALDAVFPGRYKFRIFFEIKRNKTEARIALLDGEYEIDPMYSNGGGVTDILSFALRIALLIISKNRKVLILDEPFKFISNDLKEDAFGIMKRLSEELGIQIIAVTHESEMIDKADKVIKFKITKGVSNAQA